MCVFHSKNILDLWKLKKCFKKIEKLSNPVYEIYKVKVRLLIWLHTDGGHWGSQQLTYKKTSSGRRHIQRLFFATNFICLTCPFLFQFIRKTDACWEISYICFFSWTFAQVTAVLPAFKTQTLSKFYFVFTENKRDKIIKHLPVINRTTLISVYLTLTQLKWFCQ